MTKESSEQRGYGIQVANLRLEFQTREGSLLVLDSLSFDVQPGQTLALVGPSGCGKTTLLRVLAGMEMARKVSLQLRGTATIGGMTPREALARQITALVPQSPSLLPWRTVFENAMLPFEVADASSGKYDWEIAAGMIRTDLQRVGLSEFSNSLPIELSGGMQSRVAIVRAIVRRPQVMLLDEPFGALDEITRQHLQQEIDGICSKLSCTTVLVTHSVQEAVFLADRVAVLSSRPARIMAEYCVALPHPRKPECVHLPEFRTLVREITENMDRTFTTTWRK